MMGASRRGGGTLFATFPFIFSSLSGNFFFFFLWIDRQQFNPAWFSFHLPQPPQQLI